MERNKCVKKSSSMYKLDPYIGANGLLRERQYTCQINNQVVS